MADEAKDVIESLKSMLHTQYGNEVLKHFPGQSLNISGHYEEKYRAREEPLAKEIEKYFLDANDESEGILEPGFLSIIQAEEYGLLGDNSIIHLSQTKEDNSVNKVSTPTLPGVLKNSNRGSDDSKSSEESDEETVDTKFTANSGTSSVTFDASVEDKVSDPKRKFQLQTERALAKANISQNDFNIWKVINDTRVRDIQSLNTKPYRAVKQLISLMKREREEFGVIRAPRAPKQGAKVLAVGSRSGPIMRKTDTEKNGQWSRRKKDSDWRILCFNVNNFPSERNGSEKAK